MPAVRVQSPLEPHGDGLDHCFAFFFRSRHYRRTHGKEIGMAAVERKVVTLDDAPRRTRLGRPPGSTGSQIERNKHRLASLVVLGKRNGQIAREFGVSPRTIHTWLNDAEVQEAIRELEEERRRSTERLLAGLDRRSVMRMDEIIRKGGDKEALRAIALLWTSLGRLPQKGASETNAFNQQQGYHLNFDRADAKAAMALLRQERERQEREKDITLHRAQ
jgi:hypothetical protein